MKKIIALLLVLVMLVSLVACGGKESAETPAATSGAAEGEAAADGKKVIKVGITGAVDTLNPFAVFTTGTWATLPAYYERLANYSQDNSELTPQLAKSWTQVDDYTYDVEIWDYIKDWNGNHITADDILFCYNSAIASGVITGLDAANGIEKTGDYSLRFTLNTTEILAIEMLLSAVDIVSQKEYEASADNMASACVGTGRYIVKEFIPSSSMVLVKNENYWQTDELCHYRSIGEADEIHILTILEEAQLAVALETGTIDVAKISTASAGSFIGNDAYDDFTAASTAYYYLRFNVGENSVFYNNQALRQAICYAINVDDIVTGTYRGDGVKMSTIALPSQAGYQDKWDDEGYYEYDLEKAKQLMAEAGYPNGGLTVRLVVLGNDICKSWSTIVQAQLAQIGIDVQVEALDSAVWYTKCITGDFDICGFNVNRPHVAVNLSASVGGATYYGDVATTPYLKEILEDKEMQQLFTDSCDSTKSTDELIDATHQMIKEKAYAYPLAYPIQHTYARQEANLEVPGYAQNYILVPSCFQYAD